MHTAVDVTNIQHASQEVCLLSDSISAIAAEMEEIQHSLKKQSTFKAHLQRLREVQEILSRTQYKLNVFAQALDNIGTVYARTEDAVQMDFEQEAIHFPQPQTNQVDVQPVSNMLWELLQKE